VTFAVVGAGVAVVVVDETGGGPVLLDELVAAVPVAAVKLLEPALPSPDVHAAHTSVPSPPSTRARRLGGGRSGVIAATLRAQPVPPANAVSGLRDRLAG
jgi:hypothetical protein